MFPFFRKNAGHQSTRDRNNLVRDEHIKKKLKIEFAHAVKELQKHHIGTQELDIDRNDEGALHVCTVLEAIFLHGYIGKPSVSGLRNIFVDKHQASDGIPEVSFWNLLKEVTHKDVITQLKHLVVETEVGLCRAWIRLALNDHLMESYLDAILSDKENLSSQYTSNAFLMDTELPFIIKDIMQGVAELNFNLNYNSSKLNAWNAEPLILCGLLPPDRKKVSETTNQSQSHRKSSFLTEVDKSTHGDQRSSFSSQEQDSSLMLSPESKERILETLSMNSDDRHDASTSEVGDYSEDSKPDASDQSLSDTSSINSTSNSLNSRLVGNQIGAGVWSGWSSAFEPANSNIDNENDREEGALREQPVASPANILQASFDTILKTYGTSVKTDHTSIKNLDEPPPTRTEKPKANGIVMKSPSQDENLQDMNYEIVSHGFSFDGSDEQSRFQFEKLHEIAMEKGLDKQNFQCKGCGRPIGLIYGPYRVCFFDGWYYCIECHDDEENLVPAKIIQSWDFKPLKVCKYDKSFIAKIEEEPLFHIDEINPTLYNSVVPLNEVKMLRIQLQHIKGYVFTCQSDLIEDFRRRIWPREYLCDDVHQYSLLDLVQVNNGQLSTHLKKVIAQFSRHIYKCSLCSQKGFICEICGDERIIYPFEVLTTVQCHRCQSLFHKSCKKGHRCPKCIRLQFRAKKDSTSGNGQERIVVSQSNDSNLGEIGVL